MGLIFCIGVSNPLFATYRLEQVPPDRVTRMLSAWSVSSKGSIAVLTALGGLLATYTGPRIAIGVAGALLLGSPLLLPWPTRTPAPAEPDERGQAAEPVNAGPAAG
jgi:hypothetical protein